MIARDSRGDADSCICLGGRINRQNNLEEVNALKVWVQETMKQMDQELKGIDKVPTQLIQ